MTVKKASALGCGLLVCACVVLAAVRPNVSRTQTVDMYDLLIDGSVFPEGWYVCIGPAPPPEHIHSERGELEFLYVGFCPEGFEQGIGGAEHDVFRYAPGLDVTLAYYLDFSRREFSNRHMVTPYAIPGEWSYHSPVANHFKFACAELEPFGLGPRIRTCTAVAQYGEYISVFGAHMSHMTLEDMERILTAIDDRMALHLGKGAQ
jgi:hypothetical protein